MSTRKLKYEKPLALDVGSVATVHGDCRDGSNAAGTVCGFGHDVDDQPYCPEGDHASNDCETLGETAAGPCSPTGSSASQGCWSNGNTAVGICSSTGSSAS